MNGKALQANFQAADQASQVILFSSAREGSAQPEPFLDNLDHLQALEQEAKLMLAAAELRRCQQNDDSTVLRKVLEIFPCNLSQHPDRG
jgi:hypothetical protein